MLSIDIHIDQQTNTLRLTFQERDWKEPDRIVGELLQPGGIDALRKLNMLGTIIIYKSTLMK